MQTDWLQQRINELERHLTHFHQVRDFQEDAYRYWLDRIDDIAQKSQFMEKHMLYRERNQKCTDRLKTLLQKAVSDLSHLQTDI